MIPLDPYGHEYHSGYGVVAVNDAKQVDDIAMEKRQAVSGHKFGDHYRDSTTSTLLPPQSPGLDTHFSTSSTTNLLSPTMGGEDQRMSYASSSALLPPSMPGDDQRFSYASSTIMLPRSLGDPGQRDSTASTLYPPQSPRGHERNSSVSASLLPQSREEEQDISDTPFRREWGRG